MGEGDKPERGKGGREMKETGRKSEMLDRQFPSHTGAILLGYGAVPDAGECLSYAPTSR